MAKRPLATAPDDVSVARPAGVCVVDSWRAREQRRPKAYKYARAFEDVIDKMPVATGRDAAHQQDDQERAIARALLYQARARTILDDSADALRLVARAFSAYPGEETAREWAERSTHAGQHGRRHRAPGRRIRHSRSATPPMTSVRATAFAGRAVRQAAWLGEGPGRFGPGRVRSRFDHGRDPAQKAAGARSEFLAGGSHGVHGDRSGREEAPAREPQRQASDHGLLGHLVRSLPRAASAV